MRWLAPMLPPMVAVVMTGGGAAAIFYYQGNPFAARVVLALALLALFGQVVVAFGIMRPRRRDTVVNPRTGSPVSVRPDDNDECRVCGGRIRLAFEGDRLPYQCQTCGVRLRRTEDGVYRGDDFGKPDITCPKCGGKIVRGDPDVEYVVGTEVVDGKLVDVTERGFRDTWYCVPLEGRDEVKQYLSHAFAGRVPSSLTRRDGCHWSGREVDRGVTWV